jgi:hypothetical protein
VTAAIGGCKNSPIGRISTVRRAGGTLAAAGARWRRPIAQVLTDATWGLIEAPLPRAKRERERLGEGGAGLSATAEVPQ